MSVDRYDDLELPETRYNPITGRYERFDDDNVSSIDTLQLVTDGFVTFRDGFRPITFVTHGLYPLFWRIVAAIKRRFDDFVSGRDRYDRVTPDKDRYDKEVG